MLGGGIGAELYVIFVRNYLDLRPLPLEYILTPYIPSRTAVKQQVAVGCTSISRASAGHRQRLRIS